MKGRKAVAEVNKMYMAAAVAASVMAAGCRSTSGCGDDCRGEWVDVFDATLSNAENGGAGWHYEADGCLAPTNAERILSARSYGPNFDLDCTYRLDAAGNSGLYIYDSEHPKAKIEIQMLDDTHPQYQGKQKQHQVTGSLYGHSAATRLCSKPAGEWNRMQVACRGKSVRVWVNGELVIDEDLAKFTDAKTNPDGSLTPERQRSFYPWAEIPTCGKVGFQGIHGGGAVHVKSLKVREAQ